MNKEQIEGCYRQMYQGMIDKDRKILSEVLDDRFILIHMTGMRQSKEAFISAVENGTLNYFSANHQNIETDICGDTAQLIGQSIVSAAVFGGGRHIWRLQQTIKLVRKNDTWRIVESIASTY